MQESQNKQHKGETSTDATFAKRNEVGVQLLSRDLHSQVFKNVFFPPPEEKYIRISKSHLAKHKLDPALSSVHPEISFTLPPLQGDTIDAHFHAIGAKIAQPYLSLSKEMASITLPPQPDSWVIESGWTKYWTDEDGVHESVEAPDEDMLVFDVETLPNYSPFAVMACAASPTAWYTWISPWLLGEMDDPAQLVPIGNPSKARIVIGHNVAYDRCRTLEEYRLERPGTRWLDTMALHVAVNGISSHQRPAWGKYRKQKMVSRAMKDEAIDSVKAMIAELKGAIKKETDKDKKAELKQRIQEMEESLPALLEIAEVNGDEPAQTDLDETQKRWEELTSANSLADVAYLHCGIEVDKSTRDDFMTSTPEAIRSDINSYLTYCANDVAVTHRVFQMTLPAFLQKCPSPVSFAGICSMGSSFLPVDDNWERYIQSADSKYQVLESKVVEALRKLAEEARLLMPGDRWKGDVWLEQLDWTPKQVRNGDDQYEEDYPFSQSDFPAPGSFSAGDVVPKFFNDLQTLGVDHPYVKLHVLPYLLRLQIDGHAVRFTRRLGWHGFVEDSELPPESRVISPLKTTKIKDIFDKARAQRLCKQGRLACPDGEDLKPMLDVLTSEDGDKGSITEKLSKLGEEIIKMHSRNDANPENHGWWPWLQRLEWAPVKLGSSDVLGEVGGRNPYIPAWYFKLGKSRVRTCPESLEVTLRSRMAPLLFKLKWLGWPLVHSREHGWTFRVEREALKKKTFETRLLELSFYHEEDETLDASKEKYAYFKLPHKDGDTANVGNPLAKTFIKFAADGTLSSPNESAVEALNINAQCSYWISARDRIMKQLVIWDKDGRQGLQQLASSPDQKWGMILPQVITMGTVTRRAIERTWLTASNAKANRIGSELKAMVRAPEGYAIVGADVDSEELWISSCMGDAQFGFHGATAIGWMTLEGTKKAGTDLHSKTASILGISRDQAKVFNYSRIYGAGMKHAMLLLLQGNASMLPEEAQRLAGDLYASTKGKNTHRSDLFGNKFWYGGTESYLFNKLEQIAMSDEPKTPALGCGVTYALSKQYLPEKFGSDYLPSRINWVVQSSGVDYLHLLIVAMEHLLQRYDIDARYLISVHDELRYLVKEEDKYRAALALQVANLWTRSMFAYRLGMDDLPQGIAFFSAVDVDKVLRKEVDMSCVTPSQPVPISPGETLDIAKTLEKTNGGSLNKDGSIMERDTPVVVDPHVFDDYVSPDCLAHRAKSEYWLDAQSTDVFERIKFLAEKSTGKSVDVDKKTKNSTLPKSKSTRTRRKPLARLQLMEEWDGKEM
ncbi:hypothetical protein M422DRAFT_213228 [Sphaerobolus stellatus SS14]|uniref:Mitochondrial DNA polymerase catalytic subunit n=1 Tax=Sphaerobolus stellatus (strain SS14) TaxID=990650 RepID=A0A0C9UHH7_SPHS4|nr:hypothetical protein M422DRAFT_213228 [Sphaerobolus stellatus SS14]